MINFLPSVIIWSHVRITRLPATYEVSVCLSDLPDIWSIYLIYSIHLLHVLEVTSLNISPPFFIGLISPIYSLQVYMFTVAPDHTQRHTHTHTHTLGRTSLDMWSDHHRGLYLHNTEISQRTNIHTAGGIRTRNHSKRAATNRCLR